MMLGTGKPREVLIVTSFHSSHLAGRAGRLTVPRIKENSDKNNVLNCRQLVSREWTETINSYHVLSLPDIK